VRRWQDEQGQVLPFLMVGMLVVTLGFAAFAIDVGHAYFVKRQLQASSDAAALAGAQALPDADAAATLAHEFGPDGQNPLKGADEVDVDISTTCLSNPACTRPNAVVVQETVTMKTTFAKLFGVGSFTLHSKATACSPCGLQPLDIVLVLDRTGSMCQDSSGHSDPACTDLNNARSGMKTFLSYLDPKLDWVGLTVLPPAQTVATRCGTSSDSYYNSKTSAYTVVPLSSDYKLANGSLNSASNLVSTIDCVKGGGATAYANAIEAAQAELDAHGRSGVRDVIVLLSDGAANTGPNYYPVTSPYRSTPCNQGVASAAASRAKGTIVYSIGYALDDDTGGCRASTGSPEMPAIAVEQALAGIADPGNFYDRPTPGQLNTIYTNIAVDILSGRSKLVDNGT
jgi:hypothetical protein